MKTTASQKTNTRADAKYLCIFRDGSAPFLHPHDAGCMTEVCRRYGVSGDRIKTDNSGGAVIDIAIEGMPVIASSDTRRTMIYERPIYATIWYLGDTLPMAAMRDFMAMTMAHAQSRGDEAAKEKLTTALREWEAGLSVYRETQGSEWGNAVNDPVLRSAIAEEFSR